jgi:predicted GIY-YIG superfamily endonuclease
MSQTWYCYILKSSVSNRTYNGSTNNPIRRLRQHNGEITGGARRTKIDRPWFYCAIVKGMPDHINALQLEWCICHPDNKRKRASRYNGIKGRIMGLNEVLKRDKWTNQSIVNNREVELEVWILKEYEDILIDLPENIKVVVKDDIMELIKK